MWSKGNTPPLLVGVQTCTTTLDINLVGYEKNWKPDLHTIPKKKYQKALKKSKRNIILLFIVCLYVESIIVCAKGTIKNGTEKTKYGEYIYEDGALMAVRRNNYGILAKNVNECKVSTGGYGSSVFVKKSGKKNYVYEILLYML